MNVVGLVGLFKRDVFQHGFDSDSFFSRVSFLSVFREEGPGILPKGMRPSDEVSRTLWFH